MLGTVLEGVEPAVKLVSMLEEVERVVKLVSKLDDVVVFGVVCAFVVIRGDSERTDDVERVGLFSELADAVLDSGLVAIEITVDFDSWHSPIQQLHYMSI